MNDDQAAALSVVRDRAEHHLRAVVQDDRAAMLDDVMPDRWQQVVASLVLPTPVTSAEVLDVHLNERLGCPETLVRYVGGDDGSVQPVRHRWMTYEGTWRIAAARNMPPVLPPPVQAAIHDPIDAEHWNGMNAGELRVQQCTACSNWIWGPRHLCPRCHSFELGYRTVAPEGVVYSWTRTAQPFTPEMSGHVPYVLVLVELPHAGNVRVIGVLDDEDDDRDPAIGDQVEGDFQPIGHGRRLLRWGLK
jgi:uncharacterized OB-fold protein